MTAGRVRRVNGPVLEVVGLQTGMLDLVEVGARKLPGEVIALDPEAATVQVYAYTGGVRPGDDEEPLVRDARIHDHRRHAP